MQAPVQLTYRHLSPTESLDLYLRRKADKLSRHCDRIVSCRVALEAPHRHHVHGRHYRVRISVSVPGSDIVISKSREARAETRDVYAAIDEACDEADRRLEDYAKRYLVGHN